MKKVLFLALLVWMGLFWQSCAQVFYSPDAMSRANAHQIIAIAPPKVSIAARRKVDPEAIKEQQRTESLNFQKEIASWLLRRKMQGRMLVEVQDVETTNAKLRQAGYFETEDLTPAEICEVLGVDGLITSNFALSKPMSDGASIALGALTGVWGASNQTTVTMDVHDFQTRKMIWSYSHEASGTAFSNSAQLVDGLMRNASKKMPYTMSVSK